MTDERAPEGDGPQRRAGEAAANGPPSLGDILTVAEGIRTDLRAMEGRVTTDIRDVRDDFEGFVGGHVQVHASHDAWSQEKYGELVGRLNGYDLDMARRQGALGLVRWGIDLAGRNWKLIATAALTLLTFLGNIRIDLVAH